MAQIPRFVVAQPFYINYKEREKAFKVGATCRKHSTDTVECLEQVTTSGSMVFECYRKFVMYTRHGESRLSHTRIAVNCCSRRGEGRIPKKPNGKTFDDKRYLHRALCVCLIKQKTLFPPCKERETLKLQCVRTHNIAGWLSSWKKNVFPKHFYLARCKLQSLLGVSGNDFTDNHVNWAGHSTLHEICCLKHYCRLSGLVELSILTRSTPAYTDAAFRATCKHKRALCRLELP